MTTEDRRRSHRNIGRAELGPSVPDDVSVAGYDDVPRARLAVAARLLSDVTGTPVEVDLLPAPELIVRDSTAALP